MKKQNQQQGDSTLMLIAIVVLLIAAATTAYIALSPSKKTMVPDFKASYSPETSATKPTEGFKTEKSLSTNDTTDAIEKELDETTIDETDTDLNNIDSMIKQL